MRSLELLDATLKNDPLNYGLLWRAARACYWICDRSDDPQVDGRFGARGMDYASKALLLAPDAIEGHYYNALCMAEYADSISVVKALAQGVGNRLRDELEYCYQQQPLFDYAGPCIGLGRFYQLVPWPLRDRQRAQQAYQRALQAFPWVYRNRVYLAELYIEMDKPDQANKLLDVDIACPQGITDGWECGYFRQQAAELRQSLVVDQP
ncbi:MAG: tetratricopeptide repeat protein [Candidatus Alcyoniella australis]|nr:tetratricopeptide repeat protein [Candidatus Alcyoniella australis]